MVLETNVRPLTKARNVEKENVGSTRMSNCDIDIVLRWIG
jgi:hypothetical protein